VGRPLHGLRPYLPRNRIAFERDGLEPRKALHVLGREYHAEACRDEGLKAHVMFVAVGEVGRLLASARRNATVGDVACRAF
jgi:hypothetical protein